MIRYNAHMMIQKSRLLEAQADMMDADENPGYDGRNTYGRHDSFDNTDNMSCITEHDSDVEVVPKVSSYCFLFH